MLGVRRKSKGSKSEEPGEGGEAIVIDRIVRGGLSEKVASELGKQP